MLEVNFCQKCGQKLVKKEIGDEGLMPYCVMCEKPIFDMFYITPITMVINEFNEICLLKKNYVSKDYLVFVAGYLKKNENIEEAIKREVLEETGLIVKNVQYEISSFHHESHTLRLGFVAFVQKTHFKKSEKEVDDLNWYTIDEAIKYLNPAGFSTKIYLSYLSKLKTENV